MIDTTKFLSDVKIKGSIPTGRYSDPEILSLAYDKLMSSVVDTIIALREEFYVQSEDQIITADVSAYAIPYRALGLALREVKKIQNTSIIDLWRMSPEEITSTATGNPVSFYLQGQDVVLYPTPANTQDTLRLSYYRTPSKPVEVTDCAIITAIAGTLVTAAPPTTWLVTDQLDFVSRQNGHKCLGVDITPTAITTTDISFNLADIPSTLAIGDYVCLAGEAPYLQIPDACFAWVVKETIVELLASMGDTQGFQIAQADAEKLKAAAVILMTNRVAGALRRSRIKL